MIEYGFLLNINLLLVLQNISKLCQFVPQQSKNCVKIRLNSIRMRLKIDDES